MKYFIGLLLIVFSLIIVISFSFGQSNDSTVTLTGHESHAITLDLAKELLMNFRSGLKDSVRLGEFFGKDALDSLLHQPGCIGARIYYAKKDDGTPVLVIVGVDSKGVDMPEGLIEEIGIPCPPFCDTRKILGN
jgi:hypothetical protein